MIIDKKTEVVEAEVDFLRDLDVTWVSLVSHGANRLPFKVIKSESVTADVESEDGMFDIIHSIIVPKNVNMEVLKETNPWMNGISFSSTEDFDEYTKFVQVSSDKFVDGSIRVDKLDDGVIVLVGKVDNPDPNWVSMYREDSVSKASNDTTNYSYAFKNSFSSELNNLIGIMVGALKQSGLEQKKKKGIISSAMDAFKVFVMAGIDVGGIDETMNIDASEFNKDERNGEVSMSKSEDVVVEVASERPVNDILLEKFDSLVSKIDSLLNKVEAKNVEENPEAKAEDVVVDANSGVPEFVAKFEEKMNNMQTVVEQLVQKFDSLDDVVPESVTKSEDYVDPVPKDNQDIWVGSIFKK